MGAVRRLLEEHPGRDLVLVGHGTAWTVLRSELTRRAAGPGRLGAAADARRVGARAAGGLIGRPPRFGVPSRRDGTLVRSMPDEPIKTLPLVFDEPRGRSKPPRHLADLGAGRAQGARRRPRPARLPRQAALHALLRAARRRPGEMTDLPAADRDQLVESLLPRADDPAAHAGGRQGHHPQDAVAAVRRGAGRVGADALPRPGHDVRLLAGRLRHGLPVLRHRPGRAAAQHVHRARSSSRSSPARGPSPAARSPAARAGSPTWCSWAWASRWPTTRP